MQIGTLLHASLENAMLKRDLPGLEAILADLGRDDDIRAIRIVNPEFEVRFATDLALTGQTLDLALIRRALETRSPQAETLPEGTRAVEPVKNREPCQQCHGPMSDHPVNGLLVIDYAGGGLDAEARRTGLLLALAGLASLPRLQSLRPEPRHWRRANMATAFRWLGKMRFPICPTASIPWPAGCKTR